MRGEVLVINNGGIPPDLPQQENGIPFRIINNVRNLGTAARNLAINSADYIIMLDDDAFISAATVTKAVNALKNDPAAGAAALRIHGSEGDDQACLLPTVFHGCACCFRSAALREIRGYPQWHSYYGEEYEVAFRLYDAGFKILMLTSEDKVLHLRHPGGRNINRIIRLNILHNLLLWTKYFPRHYIFPAIRDTLARYQAVADKEKATAGFRSALRDIPAAILQGLLQRRTLKLTRFRQITLLDRVNLVSDVARSKGIDSIIPAGTGKFPSLYLNEIRKYGMRIPFILDLNNCWSKRSVNNIPVLTPERHNITAILKENRNAAVLTGTASIPESLHWAELAIQSGFHNVWQDGWAKYAPTGIIDLLEHQPVALFKQA